MEANELVDENHDKSENSIGSVKDVHQVVTLDMSGSPIHPRLEVRPT